MKHSNLIGGSTAARIINCPGSVNLSNTMPKQKGSKYADRGTLCHHAMEDIIQDYFKDKKPKNWPEHVIGMTFTGDSGKHELTTDLYNEKIIPALEAFDELVAQGVFGDTVLIEQHVKYKTKSLVGSFTHIDIMDCYEDDTDGVVCIVLDWKFGDGVLVDVEQNKQLKFGAGAAMESHPYGKDADVFKTYIVQPRKGDDPDWSTYTYIREEIQAYRDMLIDTAAKINVDPPIYNTGDHCRWCPGKVKCPEIKQDVLEVNSRAIKGTDVAQIPELLLLAQVAQQWATDMFAYADDLTENHGVSIDGWKRVNKQARRQWNNAADAEKTLRDQKILVRELFPPKMVSPAQAEKVLKKNGKDIKIIKDLASMVSSGTTLVPDSDKRPAVGANAAYDGLAALAHAKPAKG